MLCRLAYFYIISPLIVFGCTWFNFWATGIFLLSLLISYYFISFESFLSANNSFYLSKKTIIVTVAVATFWCFWSGIGGYVYQSGDFPWRNAIYNDLLQRQWPVYYEYGHSALNYYFGYWLIPAIITRALDCIFNFNDIFVVGLNILLLYTILGVSIFLLLLISYVRPKNNKQLFLVLMFPIFFSGLDIIGIIIYKYPILSIYKSMYLNYVTLEIWSTPRQLWLEFSSMTAQLFWVFNQAVPSWIITLLLLKEKDNPKNYGILITSALFLCPLSAVGLIIFMVAFGCAFMWSKGLLLKDKIKTICSLSNIYILPAFIIILLFMSLHKSEVLGFKPIDLRIYLVFCALEFAYFAVFIFHMYRRDMIFYIALLSLCILILFSFDQGLGDFQKRTTLPALLILSIYILRYLLSDKGHFYNKVVLWILLTIGVCAPMVEFSRGIIHLIQTKNIYHLNIFEKNTLDFKGLSWPYSNYKIEKPADNYFYSIFVQPIGE